MSLRKAILNAALPSLATTSFTRAALSSALASLPSHHNLDEAAREGVLDTVFGPGGVEGPRALVSAWQDGGARAMQDAAQASGASSARPTDRLVHVLGARLAYSAALGEHLTEAHALMASGPPASIPLPEPILALLRAKLPSLPVYSPGGAVVSKAWVHGSAAATSVLDRTGGRLPLPAANPTAPLVYAWGIADEAVYAARPHGGTTGVMREPRGAGVEWYTSRAGIAFAYLTAEAHLLQSFPTPVTEPEAAETLAPSTASNPHFPAALSALRHNIHRMDDLRGAANTLENAADSAISFFELATRSVAGIVRSRGF